ncbi:MAG: ABC transporter permease [Tuberibacillus sp.]
MEKINQLWTLRRGEFWQEASRYLKLLGNSGFMFSLYILILGGGVYYQRWIKGLSSEFPTEWILTLVFAVLVFRTPIRTFLKSADLVFLLPVEKQLAGYFRNALIYNGIFQCISILFVWAIAMPLYLHTVSSDITGYIIIFVLLIAMKAWNIYAVWQEQYVLESVPYDMIRGLLTIVFIGFVLFKMPWWAIVLVMLAVAVLTLSIIQPLSKHLLKWDKLLSGEQRQVERFYRFANMITDVPKMRNRMKPRRWLTGLTEFYGYGPSAVFKKFYLKTFIRSGEYLGIWFRLLLIGVLLMILLPKGVTTAVIAWVFTYLTAIQLTALWHEYFAGPSTILSLSEKYLKSSFLHVYSTVLSVQMIVFSIVALFMSRSIEMAGLTLISGLALTYAFTYSYVKRKVNKTGTV